MLLILGSAGHLLQQALGQSGRLGRRIVDLGEVLAHDGRHVVDLLVLALLVVKGLVGTETLGRLKCATFRHPLPFFVSPTRSFSPYLSNPLFRFSNISLLLPNSRTGESLQGWEQGKDGDFLLPYILGEI